MEKLTLESKRKRWGDESDFLERERDTQRRKAGGRPNKSRASKKMEDGFARRASRRRSQ